MFLPNDAQVIWTAEKNNSFEVFPRRNNIEVVLVPKERQEESGGSQPNGLTRVVARRGGFLEESSLNQTGGERRLKGSGEGSVESYCVASEAEYTIFCARYMA